MIKEAVILAGGFGTRLQSVLGDIPKSMAIVNDKPFLHYLLEYLRFYNVQRAVLSVSTRSSDIEKYFKSNYSGIELVYAHENEP